MATTEELTASLGRTAYQHAFRRYQNQALTAFEGARARGRRRTYLVMPPGSGKTAVGLEIVRRLGRQAVVLSPNTAIQGQWVREWGEFQPHLVAAGTSRSLTSPITALTYQAICDLDPHSADLDAAALEAWRSSEGGTLDTEVRPLTIHDHADLAHFRRKARELVARSEDHQALLSLLHANGRALVERIGAASEWTIVLDECHHLLETWGYLVRALVEQLGERVFLVGLTATPPSELAPREATLYEELFGRADVEVATPAVVKEGDLAPYRELAWVTTPVAVEANYIAAQHVRFQELITQLMAPDLGTVSLLTWLQQRVVQRRSNEGAQVSWTHFESAEAAIAQAAMRFWIANGMPLPPEAPLREAYRQPPTASDWVALIDDYSMHHLRRSDDARDLAVWNSIRQVLPSLGYTLTRAGARSSVSPVDRVVMLSAGKGSAALEILAAEEQALGTALRALVICDFETASTDFSGELGGVLDARAGSAALLLHLAATDPAVASLDPILVTGRTVACSRATSVDLCAWLVSQAPELAGTKATAPLTDGGWSDVVEIRPSHGAWSTGQYLPLVTQFFEEGRCRCLIGTRGLLGEGWDARSVNVLVDLTAVTTSTSVHQMRGRSLRLDPTLPRKVAHNWDVVCIAPGHAKGSADYERFVRKHRAYFSITDQGEIESGVSHVDAGLSPYGPPPTEQFADLNASMRRRVDERDHVYDMWRIGEPYAGVPAATLRVRFDRSPGVSARRVLQPTETTSIGRALAWRLGAGAGAAVVAGTLGVAVGLPLAGLAIAPVGLAAGLGAAGGLVRSSLRSLGPTDALDDMASALAEALTAVGDLGGAATVRVVPQPDGYYRCYVEGTTPSEARVFADALDELLAPLDQPRYVIPRYVAQTRISRWSALALLVRQATRGRSGPTVVYHAVPGVLAANRERAFAFGRAWNRHVSAGAPLFCRSAEGQAILTVQRGEDPFAVTTQMRTLWR